MTWDAFVAFWAKLGAWFKDLRWDAVVTMWGSIARYEITSSVGLRIEDWRLLTDRRQRSEAY